MQKQKQRRKRIIFISILLVVGLVVLIVFIVKSCQPELGYVCPVNDTGRILPYNSQLISKIRNTTYATRYDGGYIPALISTSATIDGNEYKLKIETDKQFLNPFPGDKTKFSVSLLRNGRKVRSMPTDDNGDPVLKYVQIFVGFTSPKIMKIGKVPHDHYSAIRGFPFIYSKQAGPNANEDVESANYKSYFLDLTDGSAEFEYTWFPSEYAAAPPPYLDFQVYAGSKYVRGEELKATIDFEGRLQHYPNIQPILSANRILCFIDIFTNNFEPTKFDVQTRGDFYYDVDTIPQRLVFGQEQVVKINITSKYSKNNRVNTNPYQRVAIYTLYAPHYTKRGGLPGRFVIPREAEDPKIFNELLRHGFSISKWKLEGRENAQIDLINGQGSVYFAFDGDFRLPSFNADNPGQYLYFSVHPANYVGDVQWTEFWSAATNPALNLPSSSDVRPYRIEQQINIPPIPDDGKRYDFLYQTWFEKQSRGWTDMPDNQLSEAVNTIISVPIGGQSPLSSRWPLHLIWIISLQSMIIIFGSGTHIYLKKKNKSKNEKQSKQ